MKKLCFGSLLKVLKLSKKGLIQREICDALIQSIVPDYVSTSTDLLPSELATGKKNVPPEVRKEASRISPSIVAERVRTSVLPLVGENARANVVLTLQDIIRADNELRGDTTIELVNHRTKDELLSEQQFIYHEFLAGILLYVCTVANNQGSRKSIDEITKEYIQSFDGRVDSIQVGTERSKFDGSVAARFSSDAHRTSVLADCEFRCLKCRRHLFINKDGKDLDRAEFMDINGKTVPLCGECKSIIRASSSEEKADLVKRAELLSEISHAIDDVALCGIEKEAEALLRAVNELEPDTDLHEDIVTTPVPIDRKISDRKLLRLVRNDVVDFYGGVNAVMDQLAGESSLNTRKFIRYVNRMYVDIAERRLPQSEIFNLIVQTLYEKAGFKYRQGSQIVVSYFVQICEVFDALTQ